MAHLVILFEFLEKLPFLSEILGPHQTFTPINSQTHVCLIQYMYLCLILAHMARSRLRERHQQNLRRKLELLKAEQGVIKTERDSESEGEGDREEGEREEQPGPSSVSLAPTGEDDESQHSTV
jgi:hypothetical protein